MTTNSQPSNLLPEDVTKAIRCSRFALPWRICVYQFPTKDMSNHNEQIDMEKVQAIKHFLYTEEGELRSANDDIAFLINLCEQLHYENERMREVLKEISDFKGNMHVCRECHGDAGEYQAEKAAKALSIPPHP